MRIETTRPIKRKALIGTAIALFGGACGAQTPRPQATAREIAAPRAQGVPLASSSAEALRLIEKAVAAMGGDKAIDAIRTLVTAGKIRQPKIEYAAPVTTTVEYPGRMKRDLELSPGVVVSTLLAGDAAFLASPDGVIELPPVERKRLEVKALQNPFSLLKSRRHPLFRAGVIPDGRNDRLQIEMADVRLEVLLDAKGRIIEVATADGSDTSKGSLLRVGYSDFRPVDGLIYPFRSEGVTEGGASYVLQLDTVRVNTLIPRGFFDTPTIVLRLTPTPVPSGR